MKHAYLADEKVPRSVTQTIMATIASEKNKCAGRNTYKKRDVTGEMTGRIQDKDGRIRV